MRKLVPYFLLIGGLLMWSCIPEPLPVGNIPQLKSKLVVSTQIVPDQSVVIFLTKSIGALEADRDSDVEELLNQITVNDATVIIYSNEFRDTLELIDDGVYASISIPFEEGEAYSLYVDSPTMGKVTSTTTVKNQVTLEDVEGKIYDTGFDTLADVSYSFNDPVGKNWYMMNVQRITTEYEADDFLNPQIFTYLETDGTFEGQFRNNTVKVLMGWRDFVPGDTLGVFLSNISEEYYNFMQLRLDSRFNFADFLGEPANYPSNINGGLGFFNLYIPDVRILVLEEE